MDYQKEYIKPNSQPPCQPKYLQKYTQSRAKESHSLASWFIKSSIQLAIDGQSSDGSTIAPIKTITHPCGKNTSDKQYWKDNIERICRFIAEDYANILDIKSNHIYNYSYFIKDELSFSYGKIIDNKTISKLHEKDSMIIGCAGRIDSSYLIFINEECINKDLSQYVFKLEEMGSDYKKDTEIGNLITLNPLIYILSILCHEIAHIFQKLEYYLHIVEEDVSQGHGLLFQNHYRKLRNKFVNPYINKNLA